MRIARLFTENFRGIRQATLLLPKHGVLIGDNNTAKTTVLEALDLALGPDGVDRAPSISERDFYNGHYFNRPSAVAAAGEIGEPPRIRIEVVIVDLRLEQRARFGHHIEFWNSATNRLYDMPNPAGADAASITRALRVTFHGWYKEEEDDFEGKTYFSSSLTEAATPKQFPRKDKQLCGFLNMRTIRTGSLALSLERGSLLDIMLRLKEVRPQMREDTLRILSGLTVANDPALGVSPVLETMNTARNKYVPKEWGVKPHLRVSDITLEHLRKVVTAFIAISDGERTAPFYRQGTGTINMLVLAMLSQIAESRQNVAFAMEESKTAIPPYAQKRFIHKVRKLASQTPFTSHSPYVLDGFTPEDTVVLARDAKGALTQREIELPKTVKPKRYRKEFRRVFCEGLPARRILIAEGPTEASAFPVAYRRLAELDPEAYFSLEALGICTVDASGEKNLAGMVKLYRGLGKRTFAICDKQDGDNEAKIKPQVELLLMHKEEGFENVVIKGTTRPALERFSKQIDWPPHILWNCPDLSANLVDALGQYLVCSKGIGAIADFLAQCDEAEIPAWIKEAATLLKDTCVLPPPQAGYLAPADEQAHSEANIDAPY
ncbi:ATP-dependent endonuclease (plasmid) [Paraburkholderia sp. PGU19]|uniref:ATP-dependent nuclease n=1 Tax=Paraburkholderia sp. PGU19 TaxID=2735434 RepID=UPI0015DC0D97|nr:TOPRIM nucleotidyl transferase/hydrolase domain-containing protein [Paraburkholderia sp. PGU19]BCG02610.1 ATP-dependent endonuclease [Paraburkholderia sp. PGU19]